MAFYLDAIKKKLGTGEISTPQLYEIAGVTETAVSYFLQGEMELNFDAVLKIVRSLFPYEEEIDLMENFILSLNKKENIRLALEYCSLHKLHYLVDYFWEKEMLSYNSRDVGWPKIYKLLHQMRIKVKTPREIRKELKAFAVKNDDMFLLVRMIEVLSFYYEGDLKTLMSMSKGLLKEIEQLKQPFIRDSFKVIILTVYAYVYRKINQIPKARDCAHQVININISLRHVGMAHHFLCYTYCLEDYEKSISHLDQAKEIYQRIRNLDALDKVEHDYVFIHHLWGKTDLNTFDPIESAHQEIIKGNKEEAFTLLQDVEETPFTLYYKGLATHEIQFFWKSYKKLLSDGDLFFAQLPQKQLLKLGENEEMVKLAYECTAEHLS